MHKLWWLGAFALLTVACAPQQPDQDEAAAGSTPAVAPEPVLDADPEDMAALKARLQVNLPTVQIDEVRPTPIEGLYEIQAGFNFGYVSLDGRYPVSYTHLTLPTKRIV